MKIDNYFTKAVLAALNKDIEEIDAILAGKDGYVLDTIFRIINKYAPVPEEEFDTYLHNVAFRLFYIAPPAKRVELIDNEYIAYILRHVDFEKLRVVANWPLRGRK